MSNENKIKIRRNADGQQNLSDLRKALAATTNSVYEQGGNWVASVWSEDHGCYLLKKCYWWAERQAIQKALGLSVESPDEARYYAGK